MYPKLTLRLSRTGSKSLAALLAILLAVGVGITATPPAANAAVVTPMTNIYNGTVDGNYLMAGNGVLGATDYISSYESPDDFHNGVQQASLVNDNLYMSRSNTVAALARAGADTSSSATFTIPTGAKVVKAFLFWQGSTGYSGTSMAQTCSLNAGTDYQSSLAAGSPQTRKPMLQIGTGAIASVTGTITVEPTPTSNSAQFYSGWADVSAQFASVPSGTQQTLNVGNIWAAQGANCYAGWSVALVYDHGQFVSGDATSVARNVIITNGHVRIQRGESQVIDYSGFTTQQGDISASFFLGEGDRNLTGDYARYSAGGSGTWTRIPGATGETNNIGVGQAAGSVRYQGTSSGTFFNGNVDVRNTSLTGIPVGTKQIGLELATDQDTYLLQSSALAVPVAKINIEKTATGSGATAVDTQALLPGEAASFTITVQNSGSVPVSNVAVADPRAPACARTIGSMDVGAQVQYTCTAPPTNSGYTNTATATGAGGGTDLTASDASLVTVASIGLTKVVTPGAGYTGRVGDTLGYTFTITNNGTSPLSKVHLTDAMAGLQGLTIDWANSSDRSTPEGTLAANEIVVARASYTLTQADVDRGSVTNANAIAGGFDPRDRQVTATATATQTITPAPQIALTKRGTLPAGASGKAGDVVTYTFSATNTGNVTLSNVSIADPMPGLSARNYTWPGAAGVLAPGQTVTATATVTLTQAMVNGSKVTNTATVTGTPPSGSAVTASSGSTVTILSSPALEFDKTGVVSGDGAAGDTIRYTFTLKNTGNVTLTSVGVNDPGLTGITASGAWPSGTAGTLQPGQTMTFVGTHTITQANVNSGSYANAATATGTPPSGSAVTVGDTFVAPLNNTPGIDLAKTGKYVVGGAGNADDRIDYTFVIANHGRSTLQGVTLSDPMVTGTISYAWPGAAGVLEPGQSVTATASVPMTQAMIDSGEVTNTATARGTAANGAAVAASATAKVTVPRLPAIEFDKSSTPPEGTPQAGTNVPYTFVVTNTGNVTLTDVGIDDPMFPTGISYAWPGAANTLAPGQSVTATASHAITQAEIDDGQVVNTATATGTGPSGATATETDSVTTPIGRTTQLAIEKTGALAEGATGVAGDTVTYTFVVRNDGNDTVRGITLSDPMPGLSTPTAASWPGETGILAPGQSVTFTASYRVTQANVDSEGVTNLAAVQGTGSDGGETIATDTTTVEITPNPDIALEKTVVVPEGAKVGDSLEYAFTVRNTGNVTLDGVRIDDPLVGDGAIRYGTWPTTPFTLAPGESVEASATYVIRQADIDAGRVVNTATAAASSPNDVVVAAEATATATLPQAAEIEVTKTAVLAGTGVAGNTVTYTIVAHNSGTTTLTGVTLNDPMFAAEDLVLTWPSDAGTLAPGQSVTARATHTVTQAEVDAGSITNTATATADSPTGPVTESGSATVELSTAATLAFTKTASVASPKVGDVVTYAFALRNTGAVTLHEVGIADPMEGLSAVTIDWSTAAAAGSLAPGEAVAGAATYTVTQADVDRGTIDNTATASGTKPGGGTVTETADASVTVEGTPSVSLTKTGTRMEEGPAARGDRVDYTFTITNNGTVTLTNPIVTDELDGVSTPTVDWSTSTDPATGAGSLAPRESVQATATYTLTQADVDRGSVRNDASVRATPPTGDDVTNVATETVAYDGNAAIAIDKSHEGEPSAVGDTVTYTFAVRNTGSLTLTDVSVADALPGLSAVTYDWSTVAEPGSLAPGEAVRASATLVVTQAHLDAGSIENTATVRATPAGGEPMTETDSDEVTFVRNPDISLTKRVTAAGAAAGESIAYAFTVTNSGNVTLADVGIADALIDGDIAYDWATTSNAATGPGVLAPGESVEATASHTLTQAEIDAGSVTNEATASGTPATGTPVTRDASVTHTLEQRVSVALEKTANVQSPALGEEVTYTFVVTNDGAVTLSGVTIDDAMAGLGDIAIAWPGEAGVLAPGASATGTATYTVTQADVDRGAITNTAIATGTTRLGDGARVESTVTINPVQRTELTVEKTSTVIGSGLAGDTIAYTVLAKNTGTVTLSDVTMSDPMAPAEAVVSWPAAAGVLAPGQTATLTYTHVITQAEVDAGIVRNTATASGSSPTGPTGPIEATEDVTLEATPDIDLEKSGLAANGPASVTGDTVSYRFVVENSGQLTLRDVGITDPMPGLSAVAFDWADSTDAATGEGMLSPGERVTATATYTITQANVDAGAVTNTATATGSPARGDAVSDTGTASVPFAGTPLLRLSKTHTSDPAPTAEGDRVLYTFTVQNAGTVTVDDITLVDDLAGLQDLTVDWSGSSDAATGEGVLSPGEQVLATASLPVTQAHVDAGRIVNTATVIGSAPDDTSVRETATDSVPLAQRPSIALTKSATLSGDDADATIAYTFDIVNDGTVTLSNVALSDELAGLGPVTIDWQGSSDASTGDGVLSPGETVRATARYDVTQADVDAGHVVNRALVSSADPRGEAVTDDAAVTTPIAPRASLDFTKSTTATDANVGDTITYSFEATNDGNVTLSGVAIADALAGLSAIELTWPGDEGVLAPGKRVTGTATYVVTQADVDRGSITNTATITSTTPGGTPAGGGDTVTVPITTDPSITLTKTADVENPVVGQTVTYTFVATNAGDVTLSGVGIADTMPGLTPLAITWPGEAGVLAPGQSATATATYVVTQADVDRGTITNTATANGTSPSGVPVDARATKDVGIVSSASIAIEKSGVASNGADSVAGDTVTYTFVVTNDGARTLGGITIADELPGITAPTIDWSTSTDESTAPGSLAPRESVTATATYTLTQADVDARRVDNVATVTGTPAVGDPVTARDDHALALAGAAALSLSKTHEVATPTAVGDVVTYTLRATNTGDVTISNVTVTDELAGLTPLVASWPDPAREGVLLPGETVTITTTLTVTQAHVDGQRVINAASVTGTDPTGGDVTPSTATDPIDLPFEPGIALEKQGTLVSGEPGGTVDYAFTIRNSGNVTLTSVELNDAMPGLGPVTIDWDASSVAGTPAGTLAPGETVAASATATLSQAMIDAGTVRNDATVTATPPAGDNVGATASTDVTIPERAEIDFDKSTTASEVTLGDTITYSFRASNTGNVTLTGVTLTDTMAGLSPITPSWPGAEGVLRPGETVTGTATYTVTQADVDRGSITNAATASGTTPGGGTSTPDTVVVTIEQQPGLSVTKTGTVDGRGVAGDEVTYTLTASNTGNVTLTSVTFADAMAGLSPLTTAWPGAEGTLAPGETATATATYTLTQADVDAGGVRNVATVTADGPGGPIDPVDVTEDVSTSSAAHIEVEKSGIASNGLESTAGDSVAYTFVITNRGDVTLSGVTVTDPLLAAAPVIDWSTSTNDATTGETLAPGESVTATGTYVLTQADIDAGSVVNRATVDAATPTGTTVTDADATEVAFAGTSALTIDKTHTGTARAVGDVVTYVFTVTNSGAVTMREIAVNDGLEGVSTPEFDWSTSTDPETGDGVLAPGESVTATATLTITQAHLDAGHIENTATVTGSNPDGEATESQPDGDMLVTEGVMSLSIVKSASVESATVGGTIDYRFDVVNDGSITVRDVTITDELPGLGEITVDWGASSDPATPEGVLAPGETVSASARYTLTQADVDAGRVVNSATVDGHGGNGDSPSTESVRDDDTIVTAVSGKPSLEFSKTAAGSGVVGETLTYTFVVRNTGDVTLSGVAITDPMPGLGAINYAWPGSAGTLAPGQSVTATADYVVTAADGEAGRVVNRATVTANAPGGASVTADAEHTADAHPLPSPSGPLPRTGAELSAGIIGLALAILALGGWFMLAGKRRGRDEDSTE